MPDLDEIDWNPTTTLYPGMDFHDGTAYYTVPLKRNTTKPGKGKDADPIHIKEQATYVIPSKGKGFFYDEEALDLMGFIPVESVYQERESKWSLTSAKAFLEGKTSPTPSAELFAEIRNVYTKYVEYADENFHDVMALFLMYTYVFRLFRRTGYIHFNGTAASGKSRNLSILNTLAFNSVWASSMSAASLYRKLAGSPGTTLLDESEGFEGERGEDLRRILNAGYVDGAKAIRTEKVGKLDKFMPVEYDVFGPKALASINPLEAVIASRCIVVGMRPAIRELPTFNDDDPEWSALRDKLYIWALNNSAEISLMIQEWRDEKHARLAPRLMGRSWETTGQLIVLADYIGGEPLATTIITFMNTYFAKQQEALNATDRLRTTLRCLPRVLATKQEHPTHLYSVKDIHEVVSSYMEADATEYFKTKHVTKNLDVLGFRNKIRASGGLRIELSEDAVRSEFVQRRVEPFEEDATWLAGEVSYQGRHQEETPWWDSEEADETD